jgi:hypothetical protein
MGTFSRLCAAVMVDEGEELASTLKIGGFRFYPARDIYSRWLNFEASSS